MRSGLIVRYTQILSFPRPTFFLLINSRYTPPGANQFQRAVERFAGGSYLKFARCKLAGGNSKETVVGTIFTRVLCINL